MTREQIALQLREHLATEWTNLPAGHMLVISMAEYWRAFPGEEGPTRVQLQTSIILDLANIEHEPIPEGKSPSTQMKEWLDEHSIPEPQFDPRWERYAFFKPVPLTQTKRNP